MRRIILAVSLAIDSPIPLPELARGAVMVSPTWVTADNQHERNDIVRPPGMGDWLWDLLMDRLTVPLGPANQNIWPMGAWRKQWIVTTE